MWQYVTLGQISKTIVYKDIALEYFFKAFSWELNEFKRH